MSEKIMAVDRAQQPTEDSKLAMSTPTLNEETKNQDDSGMSLKKPPAEENLFAEILLVITTITAIYAVDILVLLESQSILRIALACGINLVLYTMYHLSHALRHQSG